MYLPKEGPQQPCMQSPTSDQGAAPAAPVADADVQHEQLQGEQDGAGASEDVHGHAAAKPGAQRAQAAEHQQRHAHHTAHPCKPASTGAQQVTCSEKTEQH